MPLSTHVVFRLSNSVVLHVSNFVSTLVEISCPSFIVAEGSFRMHQTLTFAITNEVLSLNK